MALELKYTVAEQSGSVAALFTDLTGDYSPSNPGGWGAPNPSRIAVSAATLSIYPPNPETLMPDGSFINPAVNLLSSGYPVLASQVTILPVSFNMASGSKIPDGIYTFQLDITIGLTDPATTYQAVINSIFIKQTECCIHSMIKTTCKCGKLAVDVMRAKYALWAAQLAMACNNIQDAATNLKFAQDVCNRKKCGKC